MKYATELKHCRSVRAVALTDMTTGRMVGKIIGHWSDNPNGAVCTVTLYQYGHNAMTTTAGGGGYDKYADCLTRLAWRTVDENDPTIDWKVVERDRLSNFLPLNGVEQWFEQRGVRYLEVL